MAVAVAYCVPSIVALKSSPCKETGNRPLNTTLKFVLKFEFNTVVSDLMILNNDLSSYLNKTEMINKELAKKVPKIP